MLTKKALIKHLKSKANIDAGFINKLKIAYRPLICPFDDLLNNMPDNTSVFDVGCGSGMFLSLVNTFKSPQKLAGIEISEALIQNAKAVLEAESKGEVYLSIFNGDDIPNEVSDYKYIFMIDVFHHIPKQKQFDFLSQLIQKMAIGAKLVFKDIEGGSVFKYWNKIHDLLLAGEIGNEISSLEFKKFIESKPNLEILSFSKRQMFLYPHFTFTIEKK